MKKFLSLMLVCMMLFCMVACDFTSEEELSNTQDKSQAVVSGTTNDSKAPEESSSSEEESKADISTEENQQSDVESNTESNTESEAESKEEGSENADEIAEKTISGIAVGVNGKSTLEANGYAIASDFNMTVSVTVKGMASVVNSLESAGITASIDVSGIAEKGEIELVINYSAPEGVEIIAKSDNFAKLNIEKVSSVIVPPDETDIRIVNGVLISPAPARSPRRCRPWHWSW